MLGIFSSVRSHFAELCHGEVIGNFMPEVTAYNRLVFKLRHYPAVHRPLKQVRQFAGETLPTILLNTLRAISPTTTPRFGPPKGSFSIYSSLLSERRRPARVILQDQGMPVVRSDSLQVLCQLNQHTSQPWPIFWSHHRNARLVSSTLTLMDDKKRICREAVYGDLCLEDDPAWRYVWLPKAVTLKGNWTSLISRWGPNDSVPPFTHWILDALPRLAMLAEFPADTGILVPARLAGYQKETLSLLGLLDRCRYTSEQHLLVENYYFASPTAIIDGYNPYGVNFLREKFLPKADPGYAGPRKFLIQRSNKTRGIQNEAEVNKFFTDRGWALIDTEKLTIAQEVKLFNEAEAITGVFGSGFTNAIWCRKGCKLLPLVADCWLDGYVEWIADLLGLEFHYHIFPSDPEMRAIVDLREVERMLAAAGL